MSTPVDQGEWLDSWPGPLIGGAMSGHSAPWLGTRQDNLCPQTDQVRSLFIGTSKRTRNLYSDSSVFSWRSEKICFVSDSFTLHAFDHWVYWIVLTNQNNALSMSSIYNEKTLKDPKHKPWLIKKKKSHLLLNNVKFIHVNIQYKQNQLINANYKQKHGSLMIYFQISSSPVTTDTAAKNCRPLLGNYGLLAERGLFPASGLLSPRTSVYCDLLQ